MTLAQALLLLDSCDWLKVTRRAVSACKWNREDGGYAFDVLVRRLKGQSFAEMVIRAATLAREGHKPKVTVPALTSKDACRCGSKDRLRWHRQLKAFVCPRCGWQWDRAGLDPQVGIAGGRH